MHRTIAAWKAVKPSVVVNGSKTHSTNVLAMAFDDIKADKVQYRPLGMYHPTRRWCFVLLHGAIEKKKIPGSDLDVAEKRRDEILSCPDQVVEHDY